MSRVARSVNNRHCSCLAHELGPEASMPSCVQAPWLCSARLQAFHDFGVVLADAPVELADSASAMREGSSEAAPSRQARCLCPRLCSSCCGVQRRDCAPKGTSPGRSAVAAWPLLPAGHHDGASAALAGSCPSCDGCPATAELHCSSAGSNLEWSCFTPASDECSAAAAGSAPVSMPADSMFSAGAVPFP